MVFIPGTVITLSFLSFMWPAYISIILHGDPAFVSPHGIITTIIVLLFIGIIYFIYKIQQGQGDLEKFFKWENHLDEKKIKELEC
jgi:hypothetical protein